MGGLQRQIAASTGLEVDIDLRGLFFDPARHTDALGTQAIRSLRRGDHAMAFAFADRLCRSARQFDAFSLILRAEASEGLGDFEGTADDVAAAFAIDPLFPEAARRMLATCAASRRLDIAKLILRDPRTDRRAQLAAIDAVFDAGYDMLTDLRFVGQRITGFIAWRLDAPIEIDVSPPPGMSWIRIEPDAGHVLAEPGLRVAAFPSVRFHSERDARRAMRALRARFDQKPLSLFDVGAQGTPLAPKACTIVGTTSDADITVIVPVYGDRRMTQLCLLTLARQTIEAARIRVLIVDDNPQDSVLTDTMTRFAEKHGFEIVRNDRNLGYARSVNRALSATRAGDVLLLNADVLLPPGAISRLSQVAGSAPDIGSVTPLSNNGEELSFPSPFHPGPLQPFRRICALDHAAARSNAGASQNIVNGVGYCMYITRKALDIVGELPIVYDRGYHEDVDFTLQLRKANLRNVCATNVYVGHKGAGSFKSEKQGLVARNRRILDQRFPTYLNESAAFVAADPLRNRRAAIEREALPVRRVTSLLIVPVLSISRIETFRRSLGVTRCLCLTWPEHEPDTSVLWMSDGSSPQSLRFDSATERDRLSAYLRLIGIETVYLVGAAFENGELVKHLHAAGFGIEMLFEDSLVQFPSHIDGADCDLTGHMEPCPRCTDAFSRRPPPKRGRGARSKLDATLKMTRRVHPTNAMSHAVAERFKLKIVDIRNVPARDMIVFGAIEAPILGVLTRVADVATERLLHAIARQTRGPRAPIVVLGPCLDAIRLMSWPDVFVAGIVADDEIDRLLRSYKIDILFAPTRWSGFGDLERTGGKRPKAYFDWSGTLMSRHPLDLALDPRLCDRKVAHQLGAWWQAFRSSADV